jgi:dihydroorotase
MSETTASLGVNDLTMQLRITRPDDFHVHLRDGQALSHVVPDTARQFARALVMPNLRPPVVTTDQAAAYRSRILAVLPPDTGFEPLMSLYLTDNTPPQEIARAKASGFVHAVKYYPAGATTNSDSGVTDITKVYRVLEALEGQGMVLSIHGEVTDPGVDVFDREAYFIEKILDPVVRRFSALKIVLEHITTGAAVDFVSQTSANIAATITAHHLLLNRNALFEGGLRPHHYCLPVLKRERHRLRLVDAATSGSPKFFLGTDSAPHTRETKEAACGCAGIYTAHAALEFYAEVFTQASALDKLEGFASEFGAAFYGLPRNTDTITLQQQTWTIPETLALGPSQLVPLRAGGECHWRLVDPNHETGT